MTDHKLATSDQDGGSDSRSVQTTARKVLLTVLFTLGLLSFGIAIRTMQLAYNRATILANAKLALLLSTHVIAVCAALGAVVVRRSPTEALLYFVVIVLLGNMVRREVESLI